MMKWLNEVFWGNSIKDWLLAIGIIVITAIIIYLFKKIVIIRLKKFVLNTKTSLDDVLLVGLEKSVIPIIFVSMIYGAINYLTIPTKIMSKVGVVAWILIMFYILRALTSLIKHIIFKSIKDDSEDFARKKQANGLILILNIIIWILGFIFLLDNLGYNITTLIAGLGIGGIAIALAAQTILGDLFSYFVIYFDKPFEIGDYISFDDKSGVVEYIGIKTTRLKSLSGEQLVVSNKYLTDSRVHNYRKMERRRIVFTIGIVYQTKADVIKEIPIIVKNIIEQSTEVEFDRGHFKNFGKSTLDFEFVYFILSPEYRVYMDKQQEILISVFKEFENRNIGFAYPTQTIFIETPKEKTESKD
ncbi:MAG: mechanosensitive ion channel family protein [Ferruginibacter sp.]